MSTGDKVNQRCRCQEARIGRAIRVAQSRKLNCPPEQSFVPPPWCGTGVDEYRVTLPRFLAMTPPVSDRPCPRSTFCYIVDRDKIDLRRDVSLAEAEKMVARDASTKVVSSTAPRVFRPTSLVTSLGGRIPRDPSPLFSIDTSRF